MRAFLLIVACASSGCFGNESTPFPAGFEPLDGANRAPLPAPEGGEEHPERFQIISGGRDDYDWVHGRGYLHASMRTVYDALRADGVVVDRRNVAAWTTEPIVEPGADAAMIVHNTVEDVLTVRFDITYRFALVGEDEAVAVRFQKTWGTELIGLIEGSMVLTEVEDGRTQLDFVEHLNAALSSEERIRQSALDLHASAAAQVRGQALPAY